MEINKFNNKRISIFRLIISSFISTLFLILLHGLLLTCFEPIIRWFQDHIGLYIAVLSILFTSIIALEIKSYYPFRVSSSKRATKLLGLIILLSIPFIALSANQAGIPTWILNLILIWTVLMSISAFSSALIPGIGELYKSLVIALPAMSLGVVIATSGVTFAENIISYGTLIPDATVTVVDHRPDSISLSGNYPVNALTYAVKRNSNEIRIGIPGTPKVESFRISKDRSIFFDGQLMPPDCMERYLTLEPGKRYTLILK